MPSLDSFLSSLTTKERRSYERELAKTKRDYKGQWYIDFPVKLPRFTDEELEIKRKKYQAKYGTKVAIPGWGDIIHLPYLGKISVTRLAAHRWLQKHKEKTILTPRELGILEKRRIRFIKMLASPTPEWLRNLGAVATTIDDVDDTLTTLSVVGRLALHVAPKFFSRFIPYVGWIETARDVVSIAVTVSRLPAEALSPKKLLETFIEETPGIRTLKLGKLTKLAKFGKYFGETLEVLQTTDNIFGIGICLGPIVGAIQDAILSGTVYGSHPQVLDVRRIRPPTKAELEAGGVLTNAHITWGGGQVFSDDDHFRSITACLLAVQTLNAWWRDEDPLTAIKNWDQITIRAPQVHGQEVAAIMEEEGYDPEQVQHWPSTDTEWATPGELYEANVNTCIDNFKAFCLRNKYNEKGFAAANFAHNFAVSIMQMFEGPENIYQSSIATGTVSIDLLRDGYFYPPDVTDEQIDKMTEWIEGYMRIYGEKPSTKDTAEYGESIGIDWSRSPSDHVDGELAKIYPELVNISQEFKNNIIELQR